MVPAYSADPSWCSITYTYTISAIEGDAIVTLDAVTPKFTFFEPSNLALSGQTQTDYTVTLIGTSGNIVQASQQTSFNIRVKNPCIDGSYLSLSSVALPAAESYVLYSPEHKFTHSNFDIVSNFTASLCGPIKYTAYFDSSIINKLTEPMSYDVLTQQFAIYSEDLNLLDSRQFQVQAFLQDYPTVISSIETSTIKFIDPCINPFSLTVPL